MSIFNPNVLKNSQLKTLPVLSAVQLREVFDKRIRSYPAYDSNYPVDLDDVVSLSDATAVSPVFVFGTPGRLHKAVGQAVVAVSWKRLFEDPSHFLEYDPITLPLVSPLIHSLPGYYPILKPLLYRAIVSAYAHTFDSVRKKYESFDIRKDALPLNHLEKSILRFYCSIFANNDGLLGEIVSLIYNLYSTIVIKHNKTVLNTYKNVREKFINSGVDINTFTFFNMSKYDDFKFSVRRHTETLASLVSPFFMVKYPTCNATAHSELLQLYGYAVSEYNKWNKVYSPLILKKKVTDKVTNMEYIAKKRGVYYDKGTDICLVNFNYIPVSHFFGYKSFYSTLGKDFKIKSALYSEAVDNPSSCLPFLMAKSLRDTVSDRVIPFNIVNVTDIDGIKRLIYSSKIWDRASDKSILAFNVKELSDYHSKQRSKINMAIINTAKRKGKPNKPRVIEPEIYLNASYIVEVDGSKVCLDVAYVFYKGQVYIHFPTVDFNVGFDFSLVTAPEYLELDCYKHEFISSKTLKALFKDEDNYKLFPVEPSSAFFFWVDHLALNRSHFNRLCKLNKKQIKASKEWTQEEDEYIKVNMRPYMSTRDKRKFYANLPNRTRIEISKRAGVIRERMLSFGITDVSQYPRFRYISELNAIIDELKK